MYDFEAQPESIDDWMRLAARHLASAKALSLQRELAVEAHFHAGIAIECAVKAKIISHQRFNRWPTRAMRNDLYMSIGTET